MNWKLSPENRNTIVAIVLLTALMIAGGLVILPLFRARVVTQRSLYLAVSAGELTNYADIVLLGEVIKKLPSRVGKDPHDEGEKVVYTDWLVKVIQYLKNPADQQTIRVRTFGGITPSLSMIVEDEPELTVGENVLLFLRKQFKEDEHFVVEGGGQGVYLIRENMAFEYPGNQPPKPLDALIEEIATATTSASK